MNSQVQKLNIDLCRLWIFIQNLEMYEPELTLMIALHIKPDNIKSYFTNIKKQIKNEYYYIQKYYYYDKYTDISEWSPVPSLSDRKLFKIKCCTSCGIPFNSALDKCMGLSKYSKDCHNQSEILDCKLSEVRIWKNFYNDQYECGVYLQLNKNFIDFNHSIYHLNGINYRYPLDIFQIIKIFEDNNIKKKNEMWRACGNRYRINIDFTPKKQQLITLLQIIQSTVKLLPDGPIVPDKKNWLDNIEMKCSKLQKNIICEICDKNKELKALEFWKYRNRDTTSWISSACPFCNFSGNNLEVCLHMRKHTKEIYEKFNYKINNRISYEWPFTCEICEKAYETVTSFCMHSNCSSTMELLQYLIEERSGALESIQESTKYSELPSKLILNLVKKKISSIR